MHSAAGCGRRASRARASVRACRHEPVHRRARARSQQLDRPPTLAPPAGGAARSTPLRNAPAGTVSPWRVKGAVRSTTEPQHTSMPCEGGGGGRAHWPTGHDAAGGKSCRRGSKACPPCAAQRPLATNPGSRTGAAAGVWGGQGGDQGAQGEGAAQAGARPGVHPARGRLRECQAARRQRRPRVGNANQAGRGRAENPARVLPRRPTMEM